MSGTFVILNRLGGVALLLWGVRMVRTGMERGWGDRLRGWLEQRLSGKPAAFAGGLGVTALLGSATATTLIVAIIMDSLHILPAALLSDDLKVANELASQKDAFRAVEDRIVAADLSTGISDQRSSKLFSDILRDLQRVNSVLAAAYPKLAAAGLMRGSRLRTPKIDSIEDAH